jgi:hypothetical protein
MDVNFIDQKTIVEYVSADEGSNSTQLDDFGDESVNDNNSASQTS